jgi:hypothetical protein
MTENHDAVELANHREWWRDHSNLHQAALWIRENDAAWTENGGENVMDMLEKPWKFTPEFVSACEWQATENDEPLSAVLSAALDHLPDTETTADLDAIDHAPWPETPLGSVIEALDAYDPERDDFDDEVDTPDDYEGDRYSGTHVFAPAVGDPGHCAICGEYDSDHEPVDEDIFRGER